MDGEILKRRGLRSLVVFAARPHNHICRRRLGRNGALSCLVARGGLFEKARYRGCDATHVSTRVCRHNTQQTLASLLGKIWFLEDTLGAVNVGQVEGGARVAGVENSGQAHPRKKGFYHYEVHVVVDNMASNAKVNGVDNFVVTVVFVAVEIGGLAAVTCETLAAEIVTCRDQDSPE